MVRQRRKNETQRTWYLHTHKFPQPYLSGGGIVRSDGNNFIAEMAAASMVIGALPVDRNMTMYIDSMAIIQALAKGSVSERKRIKMQGRAWKSFLRTTVAIKNRQNSYGPC